MGHFNKKGVEAIWEEAPVDYFQNTISKNLPNRFWHLGKLKAVLSLIKTSPKKVLDVGSASGWFLNEVSKEFPRARCMGIDPYKKAISYGQIKYPKLRFLVADGHKLPFRNNSFDLVICCEVLEHVLHPLKVVREIKRVLAPGGTAIIEMDSGNLIFKTIWFFWIRSWGKVWKNAHIQRFNSRKLARAIREGGLKIKEQKNFNFGLGVAYKCSP